MNMRPSELRSSVKDECFRKNLIEYLEDIIQEDLSWINSNFIDTGSMFINLILHQIGSWSLNHLLSDSSMIDEMKSSYSSTIDPLLPDFDRDFQRDVYRLVNENNVHRHTSTCYKYAKSNTKKKTCRMRMPRRVQEKSTINPDTGMITMSTVLEKQQQYVCFRFSRRTISSINQ